MTKPLGLSDVAAIAAMLDHPEVVDNVTPTQWRSLRQAADQVAESLQPFGGVTAGAVVAMTAGMHLQSTVAAAASPLGSLLEGLPKGLMPGAPSKEPHPMAMLVAAFLARDVLTGERVES